MHSGSGLRIGRRGGRDASGSREAVACQLTQVPGAVMTQRELIRRIIARQVPPRCGFWLGNPHPDSLPMYNRYFGTSTLEELHAKLGSDFRWLTPQYIDTTYRHPD